MADYNHGIKRVLPTEGYVLSKTVGYVKDKDDSGGETIGGVAYNYWPNWGGWAIVAAAKKLPDFPKNLVGNMKLYGLLLTFYKVNFWDKIGGDNIDDQDIADLLVDSAVNEGIKGAVKRAQKIVHLPETGIVDNELVKRLDSMI